MAGEKGKEKRSSVQEHGGGEERASTIRKVTQEEKGKLQIKERDKPIVVTARVLEKMIEYYRSVVEEDFEDRYFKEEYACVFPGGLARIRDLNNRLRNVVKLHKEVCTQRLQEYDVKGYLEYCYCPTDDDANLGHSSHPIDEGK